MKLLLGCVALAALSAADFRVGRSAVKITPPVGIPMAGYYNVRLAEGTHDDLYAKAIVMDLRGKKAALVALDMVSVDFQIVAAARKAIEARTGIPGANVMISATHSHTGPQLNPRFLAPAPASARTLAEEYRASLPLKIAEAVKAAAAGMTAAKVFAAKGQEESISFNRRFLMKDGTIRTNPGKLNPDIVQTVGPVDPVVAVVYFEALDGKPLATYVNFALHQDTVGGAQFSADYSYTLAKLLEKIKGPEMLTMFTIGAAGNINHVDVKSRDPQKGHAEAARIGTVLAGEVLKSYARMEEVATSKLEVSKSIVPLATVEISAAEAEKARATVAKFGVGPQPPMLEMVQAMKVADVADRKSKPYEAEVQVIGLGSQVAWAGLPGEIFTELGMAVKSASQIPHTVVVGLANGNLSYVPNRKAYPEGGYEVTSARVATGSGEAMAEAAIAMLNLLRKR